MDAALRAIANPTRRDMLSLVWDAELGSSELADRLGLTRPAASQHLRALKEAELVVVRADGNQRLYRARRDTLRELRLFMEAFWGGRLGKLKAAAEQIHRARSRG